MQVLESRPERVFAPLPLVVAACWAVLGALATREFGAIGCAVAGAAAVVACVVRRRVDGAVLALPAALGALTVPPAEPAWPTEGPVVLDGIVSGRLTRDVATATARFEVVPRGGGAAVLCVARLRRGDPFDAVLPGDRVRGVAFLRDPTRRRADGRPPVVEVELAALRVSAGPPSIHRGATWCRLRLERELLRRVRGEAGVLCTHLVLGTGPRLADDLVDAHRATGLAHLLAVSGAHATLLAWMLAAAFAGLRGRDPWLARSFRHGCGCFLLAYGAVTGFEPPVLRALVAWLLVAAAIARGRRPSVAATLAAAALVTALVAPGDLLSVSFCLSYAAVVGLAAAGAFRRPAGPREHVAQALRASAWAMATTAPLTLAYFGQLAPWTILGTPLLAPLVALMLALGVATAALGILLPPLAAVPAFPLAFLADGYAAAVRTLAELPGAPVNAPLAPSVVVLIGWTVLGVAVLVTLPTRRGLLASCALLALPHFVGPVRDAAPALTLCDVGHGQCAVVRLPSGPRVVIDCGNLTDAARAARAAERALAPRRTVDLLVISHGDSDHTAGALRLARRVTITAALLPDELRHGPLHRALAARGARIDFLHPGDTVAPLAGITVHAPAIAGSTSTNDRSLWTVIDADCGRLILPGDAGDSGIRAALRALPEGPIHALVLPHHGRGTAGETLRLLERLPPRVCLVSAGGDRSGPALQVVHAHGIPLLTTTDHGDLSVALDTGGIVTAARPGLIAPRAP